MKRLLLFFLFIPSFAFCQSFEYKSEVVEVDSTSADNIYLKAKEWFAKSFNSANDVIQMDIRPSSLIGKGRTPVSFSTIVAKKTYTSDVYVDFTLSVKFKDGRYKYDLVITDVESPNQAYPNQPFSKYIDNSTFDGAKTTFNNVSGIKITDEIILQAAASNKLFCADTFKAMDILILNLKKSISEKSSEDDW